MKIMAGSLLLLALATVYVPHILSAPFVYEDARLVDGLDRPFQWREMVKGRGVTHQSWTVLRTPMASHALNLLLHLCVVALTGALLWQMTASVDVAWFSAALMAMHPLTVETVAYAASRAELMSAVGVLAALVCATASTPWGWVLVPWAFGFAYAGKESGVVGLALLPLVVAYQGRQWSSRLVAFWLGMGSVALFIGRHAAMVWLESVNTHGLQSPEAQWALVQTSALVRLAVLSVAPFWLSVSPHIEPLSGLALVILAAGACETLYRLRHQAPLLVFGVAWCAIVAVPRFLVPTPLSPFNEHQWYLAMPGVACAIVAGVQALASVGETRRVAWSCS